MLTDADLPLDDSKQTFEAAERRQLTILSIPQELRDAIFSYIYDTFDADNIVLIRFKTPHQAGVESDKAPPAKDTLLVCKQLYSEQKKMQAAAYRRYWTTQRFLVIADRNTRKELHLAKKADLQHICRLAVHTDIQRHHKVLVSFRFEATTAWVVDLQGLPSPRSKTPPFRWHLMKGPWLDGLLQGLKDMMDSLREDSGDSEYFDESTVDPMSGQGLDAYELNQLPSMVRRYR